MSFLFNLWNLSLEISDSEDGVDFIVEISPDHWMAGPDRSENPSELSSALLFSGISGSMSTYKKNDQPIQTTNA